MIDDPQQLEKIVQRIHELIEQPGSVVTWDDRILDPDNPSQTRQIDVSIRRDDRLTIVECRLRKRAQDVNWVEELIGRKASLRADAVIAVSYGGFTVGAVEKAYKFGIILRDFRSLASDEIKRWGHSTLVSISYIDFISITLSFGLQERDLIDRKFSDVANRKLVDYVLLTVLNEASKAASDRVIPKGATATLDACLTQISSPSGIPIEEVKVRCRFTAAAEKVELTSVVAYDEPRVSTLERLVIVEKDLTGTAEVFQAGNQVRIDVDISSLDIPVNRYAYGGTVDFGRIVTGRPRFLGYRPPKFGPGIIKLMMHKVSG